MNTPRILVISPFSPIPADFGGATRLLNLMRAIAEFGDISIVTFGPPRSDEAERQLSELCDDVVFVTAQARSHLVWHLRAALARRARQALSIVSRRSFQRANYWRRDVCATIDDLLDRAEFDVVVAEHSQMGAYVAGRTDVVKVLDMQNIEYELMQRRAAVCGRGVRKLALEREWKKIRREELAAIRDADVAFVPSERERDVLRRFLPGERIEAVPNTIDTHRFPRRSEPGSSRELLFMGVTHVDANRDGVCWFVDEVWPSIEQRVPDVHLRIVGGRPPARIREYGERANIEVTGWVPDMAPYLASAGATIVPLRTGGGTRLKILEALAAGVPTVSTSIGAEGLDLVDGRHLLVADEAGEFADAVVAALVDGELRECLVDEGARAVDRLYSWEAQRDIVERSIRGALERTS